MIEKSFNFKKINNPIENMFFFKFVILKMISFSNVWLEEAQYTLNQYFNSAEYFLIIEFIMIDKKYKSELGK